MTVETARDELIGMLGEIGMSCTRPVTAYILGGGVLMMRGLKASTKDLDLVLAVDEDPADLIKALGELGFLVNAREQS